VATASEANLPTSALRALLDATPAAVGCFDGALRTAYANTAFTMATGLQEGSDASEQLPPLVEAIRDVQRGGTPRRVRVGRSRMPVSGRLFALEGALVGMVLDAGAHEALAALVDEQSALRRVAMLVAAAPAADEVFRAVAEEAGRLLHGTSAATIRYDEEHAWTVGRWGEERGFVVGTAVPLRDSEGLTATVRQTGRAGRIEDYDGVRGRAAELMRRNGYRSAVAAPVFVGGKIWGLLLVSSGDGSLGRDAERRLAGFASVLALAVESAEARAELNASRTRILEAGMAERRMLERNLHDGAQQRLVALAVQLRVLERRLEDRETAERLLHGAVEELEQALAELRELARGLHPAILVDRGLAPALNALAARSPLPVQVEGVPRERLSPALEAAVYFVVAESLTNAVKHAEATAVQVRVTRAAGDLVVEIADDGRGGADPEGGSGLRGLADRVDALGGHLSVSSEAGRGTRVRAELPEASGS